MSEEKKEALSLFTGKKIAPEEVNNNPEIAFSLGVNTALLAERYQLLADGISVETGHLLSLHEQIEAAQKISLLAFSVELYIKALIYMWNKECPPNEHNLTALYNMLTSETKRVLNRVMKMRGYDQNSFLKTLREHNSDFEDYRYYYELIGFSVETDFMTNFAYSCKTLVSWTICSDDPKDWTIREITEADVFLDVNLNDIV